ncbi:hypothetical protein ACWGQ5_56380, partial [Streptomyces sp. NPDC055722]
MTNMTHSTGAPLTLTRLALVEELFAAKFADLLDAAETAVAMDDAWQGLGAVRFRMCRSVCECARACTCSWWCSAHGA